MVSIKDFKDGRANNDNLYAVVKEVNERESKNGSKYVVLNISDGKTDIQAKMWKKTIDDLAKYAGKLACLHIESSMYNGQLSFVATTIRETDESDNVKMEDFIPSAPVPSEDMYNYIVNMFNAMKNESLKKIGLKLYEENKEQLLLWPAAKNMHHNIRGGLLYHTYRMVKSAEIAVKAYKNVDPELVVAGVALHDIGKLWELKPTEGGYGEYTQEGILFGHIYLGTSAVEKCGEELGADKTTLKHLMHIIASHHGKLEYGAIAVPKTQEAYIVSELDMLDSQLYMYEKDESEMKPGEFNYDHVKL